MKSSALCRVCLASDRALHRIADTPLEETYERVTRETLVVEGRPCSVCGVCLSALRRCRRFVEAAHRANIALDRWSRSRRPRAKVNLTETPLFSLTRSVTEVFDLMSLSQHQQPPVKQESDNAENVDDQTLQQVQNDTISDDEDNFFTEEIKYEVTDDFDDDDNRQGSDDENDNTVISDNTNSDKTNYSDDDDDHNSLVLPNFECVNIYNNKINVQNKTETLGVEFDIPEVLDNVCDETAPGSSNVGGDHVSSAEDIPLRSLRYRKRVNLTDDTTDEEREENKGEFERESHSFRNEKYPGLDPGSDPELEPFSDSSSDFYQPSSEKDEGSNSDDSICDKRRQRITKTLNTKNHDLHQAQNITEHVYGQLHQQRVETMPQTIDGHESQAAECKDSVEKGRNRDFCFYCETHVLNFARHIIRQHYLEVDVQKILAFPKKSRTRKNLITELRKKGNYISNVVRCERPMRKEKGRDQSDYLPCSNCLGFYARKQLWKHKKKCDPHHKGSQAEAQNFMCRNSLHIPSKSLQKVFSRMRADKISFVAKQDSIICQFGENCLKIHRKEHFIPVTSRKMRELAKLLIEVQKIKPEIKTYFDALKPQNYDTLVAATKIVAKYNESTDRYCSPTYTMNISTSIKQCCNIAIKKILKTETSIKSAEMQADLKTLIHLIETNWKFDVSSNAADDLNLKKRNKVSIVPLASDLKLLKDHLCAVAQNSAAQLREDEHYQNTAAYNELAETVFCRVLLLNRRRPGELQRLMLSTYIENEHKEYQSEEFNRTLTATERILVQRFKRIVIRGKRSRGVPVLFSTDVQQDLDLLISLRSKYIDTNNTFLFAKPSSMTCLCGYKVLQKHVKLSGAKNPEAISSTKLRKLLATLIQLFNMNENDIEQLSHFMGHTTGVHRRNYRLPDDIFQTAKISKLLILMEDGKADSFKGKSLDEINLNIEEDLEGEGLEREDVLSIAESRNTLQELEPGMATNVSETTAQDLATPLSDNAPSVSEPFADVSNITSRSTKKKRILVPWTSPQKKIVIDHFKRHIRCKKPPKRHECDELKTLHPELLKNKDWLKIKVFIQNYYTKQKVYSL